MTKTTRFLVDLPQHATLPRLFTARDICTRWGVSSSVVASWVESGRLAPAARTEQHLLFDADGVQAAIRGWQQRTGRTAGAGRAPLVHSSTAAYTEQHA